MRRNAVGWAGALLMAIGLVAMVAGAALGDAGAPWGSGLGRTPMGPGMMAGWSGWGGGSVGAAPSTVPAGDVVRMGGAQFAPTQLTVSAGTTVTWLNDDDEAHTVTAADGSWSSGYLAPGATYSRTFSAQGTVAYVCQYHPWMQATVTVR